jgi:hypothetical protein
MTFSMRSLCWPGVPVVPRALAGHPLPSTRLKSIETKKGTMMIITGVVLVILGAILNIGILYTIGGILAVLGLIFWILGAAGHAVGPRAHYW